MIREEPTPICNSVLIIIVEPPRITNLTFNDVTRSFTCTSTGSPATTVTWRRDGEPLTTDGGTYQLIQRVTDRRASTYENILRLTGVEDLDETRYECTVMNALGNSTSVFFINGKLIYNSAGFLIMHTFLKDIALM